mmetsp:Transcript_72094/g.145025  ORF Transcript_72094/g.145025 Transcript_72094/m.145025 type:complete len:200 (+) Transcript_72094:381-980(+)
MKRSSGGPSSESSALCSSPMRLMSHTCTRRSAPQVPSTDSLNGAQFIWKTSCWCPSSTCKGSLKLRMSHNFTNESDDPVAKRKGSNLLKERQLISLAWASGTILDVTSPAWRESHMMSRLSSPTEPKISSLWLCHCTSSTTSVCPRRIAVAGTLTAPFLPFATAAASRISQKQIRWSSDPLSRCHSLRGLHDKPYPSAS